MTQNKLTKLELTWIGKDDKREALEPRILIENPEYSFNGKDAESQNMLIHGDNLLALKSLEQEYAGKIKCIYIDPPYNTGHAFEHYDDGLEHSIWLGLMRERLEILHKLLSKDGSIWISIDDDECHYLKLLLDEIFGRVNFVSNVIWEKKYTVANDAKYFSDNHDHILVYAKNKDMWKINRLPRTEEMNKAYKNPDNHPKGVWKATPLQAKSGSDSNFVHVFPNGVNWSPPQGRFSAYSHDRLDELYEANEIWFGKDGTAVPSRKTFLTELRTGGLVARTLWRFDEVGHNHEAKAEVKSFNVDDPFSTPKPERLIERVLTLATNEGDIVLDSFLGSGTTAAVAHKMGRRWIGVELGEHAKTHCFPRMKMVCDGTDQGGISKAQNWKGGSGFKFYSLAPSLLNKDKHGNLVINKEYNADMLAAAMAKQEGFVYNPSSEQFWKQGTSSESDYIYTTTQYVSPEALDAIADQMGEGESLLICCTSFDKGCSSRYRNISIKKIPQMLLGRCAFAKDGYPLNIIDMPKMDEEDEDCFDDNIDSETSAVTQKGLFD